MLLTFVFSIAKCIWFNNLLLGWGDSDLNAVIIVSTSSADDIVSYYHGGFTK